MDTSIRTEQIEWPAGDTGARVLGGSPRRLGPFGTAVVSSLELLYGTGVRLRNFAYDRHLLKSRRARIAVISIGNIVAGGAGKTPFTRWLVQQLKARGRTPAIIHGGYGSDEPALHRQWDPATNVIEERDRVRAVERAAAAGADVAVMDDAFQHRRLARDLDIVLLPAESESRHLLPHGPLREPESSLDRANLLVVTRKTATRAEAAAYAARIATRFHKPVAVAAITPGRARPLAEPGGTQPGAVTVVTAIARPDLLLAHARQRFTVARMLAYPDHHEFSRGDIEHIRRAAGDMPILTTEKDAVKLAPMADRLNVWVLEQDVVIESGAAHIESLLLACLSPNA